MTCKLVAYRRVSTDKQGKSGLGLAAQEKAIDDHATAAGCKVVAAYTEIESGARSDRPELAKAIAHARRSGATLVVAKLDRLSRNMAFLAVLMESKVPFVCCDNPHATPFTVHILAAVAEHEAKAISQRTKAALAAYKADRRVSKRIMAKYAGNVPPDVVQATAGKLGAALVGSHLDPDSRAKGRAIGNERQARDAALVYADLLPQIQAWRTEGLTLEAIAARLNAEGQSTRRGAAWSAVQVHRVLGRA